MVFICKECGYATNTIWNNEQCPDCFFYHQRLENRPPPFEELPRCSEAGFDDYKQCDLTFIPKRCAYCARELTFIYLGGSEETGHVYHAHFCESCKIYYGYTD